MENVIQKMLIDMQLRGMSLGVQKGYTSRVEMFLKFYDRPITDLGEEEVRVFLIYLVNKKKLSPGTVNIYNSALKFFYETTLQREWNQKNLPRLKKPKKLPAILSLQEVQSLFDATENLKYRCMLMKVYSSGLRVSEVVKLKITDIDSKKKIEKRLSISTR